MTWFRGDIRHRDYQTWTESHWDWSWLNVAFAPNRTSPSDIDAIIERNGQFLVFECKPVGCDVSWGQRKLLAELAKLPGMTVVFVWGTNIGGPVEYAVVPPLAEDYWEPGDWPLQKHPTNRDAFVERTRRWWSAVNGQPFHP